MDSSGALGYGVSSRRRPLHICAVSFMAISHRIYRKAQCVHGPIGITAQRISILATFASPLVYVAQYLFLAALSSIDDCILAYEDIVGFLFHPSNYVFDKIEELVRITESLPGKFDILMNKFPTVMYLVPFLDWALAHLIALVCELAAWGLENTGGKDITAHKNYNEQDLESLTLFPHKNKECMVGLTVEAVNTNEKDARAHVVRENKEDLVSYEQECAGQLVSEKGSYEKDARAHLVRENKEDLVSYEQECAGQLVSEKGSYEKDGMAQSVSEKESHKEDDRVSFTIEPVTEKELYGMAQTQSGLYKEDSTKGSSEQGRAGLTIEPISTKRSMEEENRVCFTIEPTTSTAKGTEEEESMEGLTLKQANSCASNMVGLTMPPIGRKGSYKEVLERGKKAAPRKETNLPRKGYAKDRTEWGRSMNPRRAPTRKQNGKKNRANFPRSASYT